MIPVSMLLAFFIAFGIDPAASSDPLPDIGFRVVETLAGVGVVALFSMGLGYWVSRQVDRGRRTSANIRVWYMRASRLLAVVGLGTYAWIIHWVGWSRMVRGNWVMDGSILLDDLAILLPFIVIQYCIWCGIYMAEAALRIRPSGAGSPALGRFLWLRSRQSFGLILPVMLAYLIRGDILDRFWPDWDRRPWAEFLEVAALGSFVILAAPLFVRIAWPMRALPPGPMRRQLELAAERAGFRFTDILVWDTGHTMVNACVSGVLPRFRYVMLTDLLLDTLSPRETAAVFGHEIGHVVHRHQLFLGLFFLGSLSVLALTADALTSVSSLASRAPWIAGLSDRVPVEVVEASVLLLIVAVYFWRVFGGLSRTFERQADVYGTKIVSCVMPVDPLDIDDGSRADARIENVATQPASDSAIARNRPNDILPSGIRTFTSALANVAYLNGIDLARYSWRHGSIAKRIAFIESLELDTQTDLRFQRSVQRHKLILGLIFIAAFAIEATWRV